MLDLLIGDSEGTTTNISKIAWYEAPIAKTNYIYYNDQATATTADGGGEIFVDMADNVTERGVCWSTSPTPTISDSRTSDGTGTGTFSSSLTGLTQGTHYYMRAYATNNGITNYGNQREFDTDDTPTVTIVRVYNIEATSAKVESDADDNGETITEKGVCWSTTQDPTISDSHTSDGSGTGVFTSSITGLSQGTTYYIRTYATDSLGTGYSDNVSFTTDDIPSVSSTDVHSIGVTTAILKGNVTSDNGDSVTQRGVCWSTSINPTLADSYSSSGSDEGEFNANISGLTRDTKYYARAYATNSLGTSYGDNIEFTTRFQLRNMLNFDGIDDYVSASLSLPIPGTIELWVKFDNTGDQTIFQNYSGSNYAWTFMVANGGHILAYTSVANKLESTTVITPGKWYHLALTWNKYQSDINIYK